MSTPVTTENKTSNPDVDEMLSEISQMTLEIRGLQEKIKDRGVERRKIIIDLRTKGVTYRGIAETMGVTEQNVYKILSRNEF
jgi:DNA-directed RNA polymerase specialized sigma24 family protein